MIIELLEDRIVPSFLAPVSYPVGSQPGAVAAGDFRNDGITDLVVLNRDSGTVSVLLGKGDGTFQAAQYYVVDGTPVAVAAGDFNGDGKLDIVTANDPNSGGIVSVLLGNGDGTFRPAINYVLPVDGWAQTPSSLALGDFDKDGKLDVAVGDLYAGAHAYLNILIGDGAGGFFADKETVLPYYPRYSTTQLVTGDFNCDGNLDLAVSGEPYDGSLSILLGNGDGSFATPTFLSSDWNSVTAGDFNGDGKLDLLTWNGPNVSHFDPYQYDAGVWLGNGDGTFAPPIISTIENNYGSAAVADFDSDGKLDIALGGDGDYGVVRVFLGNGNGTLGSHLFYPAGPGYPQAVAAADFNGDGWPDLVVASSGSNTVSVLLNAADGSVLQANRLVVSAFPPAIMAGTPGSFTITAKTAVGATATNYIGTVHFTSTDLQAVLPADYTFTAADAGVHTFSATLKTAGMQSITATDTTTASISGTDAGLVVTPATASKFVITAPLSVAAGVRFSLTVKVEDAYGNVVTGYTATVHLSSTDSTVTLPKNYTFSAADNGVHTFTGLILRKKGSQKVTVTDTLNSSLSASVTMYVTWWVPWVWNWRWW